jgi:hypothetical protein
VTQTTKEGGTDRGAALFRARLSVRSARHHLPQSNGQHVIVRVRTTSVMVMRVETRIEVLAERIGPATAL